MSSHFGGFSIRISMKLLKVFIDLKAFLTWLENVLWLPIIPKRCGYERIIDFFVSRNFCKFITRQILAVETFYERKILKTLKWSSIITVCSGTLKKQDRKTHWINLITRLKILLISFTVYSVSSDAAFFNVAWR